MFNEAEDFDGVPVTREEAVREVLKHGASVAEFLAEMGDSDEYDGLQVLIWLGY